MNGVFITGTDTGVGKSIIAAAIAYQLRKNNINCGVMKPIQTGSEDDAELLRWAAHAKDDINLIRPYFFEAPLAPAVAAKLTNTNISIKKIINAYNKLKKQHEFLIVEGIGGLLVPLKENYLLSELIIEFGLPVIIVSRNILGAINHTVLTFNYCKLEGIKVVGIIFNQVDNRPTTICEEKNPYIIEKVIKEKMHISIKILGNVPFIPYLKEDIEKGLSEVAKRIKIDLILNLPKLEKKQLKLANLIKEWDKKYIWHPFTQMKYYEQEDNIIIQEGKGSYLKDVDDKQYIDGVASLWANVHGHRNKFLDEALLLQIKKLAHSTLLGISNISATLLAKELIQIAPANLEKVFFSDNGSTAVEVAIKLAYQWWQKNNYNQKKKFLSFKNAYHGDTLGAVSVGGIDLFHQAYQDLLFPSIKVPAPYCYRCHLNLSFPGCHLACLDQVKQIIQKEHKHIAAVIIEPLVQAAAGMITQPIGYITQLNKICKEYDVLLILDEVATGFGRTGKLFACEFESVEPDFLCLAKSITGGYLPLGVTLTTSRIYQAFLGEEEDKFFHGHTYSGNPLSCSVAYANIKLLKEKNFFYKLNKKIDFLAANLKRFYQLDSVGDIRQVGMMVGIELVKDRQTKLPYHINERIGFKVAKIARKYGILIRPLGHIIVLMPPLSISIQELKKLLDGVYLAIEEATK